MAQSAWKKAAYVVMSYCVGYLGFCFVVHHRFGWDQVAAALTAAAVTTGIKWRDMRYAES